MSDCIVFQGCRQRGGTGYGERTVNGKRWLAHRYAYFMAHGPIPDGLFVCHSCNNKGCVNVEHLYLGTAAQNTKDAYRDGLIVTANTKKRACPRCGGDYIKQPNGRRRCMACKLANDREHWGRRKPKWREAVLCRRAIDAARAQTGKEGV